MFKCFHLSTSKKFHLVIIKVPKKRNKRVVNYIGNSVLKPDSLSEGENICSLLSALSIYVFAETNYNPSEKKIYWIDISGSRSPDIKIKTCVITKFKIRTSSWLEPSGANLWELTVQIAPQRLIRWHHFDSWNLSRWEYLNKLGVFTWNWFYINQGSVCLSGCVCVCVSETGW